MKLWVIEEENRGWTRYEVPAESYDAAVSEVEMGNFEGGGQKMDLESELTGNFRLVEEKAMPLRFSEFVSRRVFREAFDVDSTAVPVPALVYPEGLYIEIGAKGYTLTLGNSIWDVKFGDLEGLATLEQTLYGYGIDEGLFSKPSSI